MMRSLTIYFCLLLAVAPVCAQSPQKYVEQGKADPVKLTYLQKGVIKLESRTARSSINILERLHGCLNRYDRSDPKSRPSNTDDISIRVLDEVIKGGKFYLVLQIDTGSGCNVMGRCGAGVEIGMYWFQFNSALEQEKIQEALIESCQQGIELEEGGVNRDQDGEELKLEVRGGKLTLKYRDYSDSTTIRRTLSYDRAAAEQGFMINKSAKERER
jgi:hypothetical protein